MHSLIHQLAKELLATTLETDEVIVIATCTSSNSVQAHWYELLCTKNTRHTQNSSAQEPLYNLLIKGDHVHVHACACPIDIVTPHACIVNIDPNIFHSIFSLGIGSNRVKLPLQRGYLVPHPLLDCLHNS